MKKAKLLENKVELPSLEEFGEFREGLSGEEVLEYLRQSYNIVASKKRKVCPAKIVKQFYDIAGANTVAVGNNGQTLMYRWDVDRFVKQLFLGTKTYWD